MTNSKRNKKKGGKKTLHRAIPVGEGQMISMCETCIYMPEGKVPQSNHDKDNGMPQQPFMYCTKKAYFPDVNYNNEGKPFYDVAKCDGYDRHEQQKRKDSPEITRAPGTEPHQKGSGSGES